jgi:putative nucleotide binding protein
MVRKEEYAYVLDIIPPEEALMKETDIIRRGFPRRDTYLQVVGEEYFTLLLVTLKHEATVEVGERVYIGDGVRDKINKIVRRLKYDELTPQARQELESMIDKIVKARERFFIDWLNKAGPLTLKLHSIELLKGIGKKTLNQILEERAKKPFESFEDFKNRIGVNVQRLIVERILREIQGNEQYYVFAAPPPP